LSPALFVWMIRTLFAADTVDTADIIQRDSVHKRVPRTTVPDRRTAC
jgi:hypothetical protein